MKKIHYLAAEFFGYSYDNYQEKIEMGHIRFTKYMPDDMRLFEKAIKEDWEDSEFAKKFEVDVKEVNSYKEKYKSCLKIVEANTIDAFVIGVRDSINDAIENNLTSEEDIEKLVEQICYRTADLGFCLKKENKRLHDYSEKLRYYDMD